MSLDQIQQLLKTYNIAPNKLLGQNFLIEPMLYTKLSSYAKITKSDVVLDAGAGFGFLTRYLSDKCSKVVAVEKDPQIIKILNEQVKHLNNVIVIKGDILKATLPHFNKVIAIPPYYLSSNLVVWIIHKKIDCATMILQKEFAERLVAPVGSEKYGWLTVIMYQHGVAQLLDSVAKSMFYPQPEVDSIILRIIHHEKKPFEVKETVFLKLVKWLFTQRNRKLVKALIPFLRENYNLDKEHAKKLALSVPLHSKRVRELSPQDFGAIANALFN
jgi:16S rRNA (adenine1518-N6/adenine1519-N6)-dimethyltransferase